MLKNSFIEYKKIGGTSVPKLQLQQIENRKNLLDRLRKQFATEHSPSIVKPSKPLIINETS